MFRKYVLPIFVYVIYRLLRLSWRFEIIESESLKAARRNNETITFAHWHGDELAIVYLAKPYRSCVMTSTSKDGEIMDRFLNMIGVKTSRGSSTRGGVTALKGLLRLTKAGYNPTVAVDGPKGPIHKAKAGVFEISKLTQTRICPVGAAASNAFVFERSWNKTYLPLPFSRVIVYMGDLIAPVSRDADAHDPTLAQRLEQDLANAGYLASQALAAK